MYALHIDDKYDQVNKYLLRKKGLLQGDTTYLYKIYIRCYKVSSVEYARYIKQDERQCNIIKYAYNKKPNIYSAVYHFNTYRLGT